MERITFRQNHSNDKTNTNSLNKQMMKDKIAKFREYLDYVERHYDNVQKAWSVIQEKCKDMKFIYDDSVFWSLDAAIKKHDESKLSK